MIHLLYLGVGLVVGAIVVGALAYLAWLAFEKYPVIGHWLGVIWMVIMVLIVAYVFGLFVVGAVMK